MNIQEEVEKIHNHENDTGKLQLRHTNFGLQMPLLHPTRTFYTQPQTPKWAQPPICSKRTDPSVDHVTSPTTSELQATS